MFFYHGAESSCNIDCITQRIMQAKATIDISLFCQPYMFLAGERQSVAYVYINGIFMELDSLNNGSPVKASTL